MRRGLAWVLEFLSTALQNHTLEGLESDTKRPSHNCCPGQPASLSVCRGVHSRLMGRDTFGVVAASSCGLSWHL